jgi:hypothetical protein
MAAIGFTATAGGIGIRIIRGVGRRFTMDAGAVIRASAGSGLRIQFGGLPG